MMQAVQKGKECLINLPPGGGKTLMSKIVSYVAGKSNLTVLHVAPFPQGGEKEWLELSSLDQLKNPIEGKEYWIKATTLSSLLEAFDNEETTREAMINNTLLILDEHDRCGDVPRQVMELGATKIVKMSATDNLREITQTIDYLNAKIGLQLAGGESSTVGLQRVKILEVAQEKEVSAEKVERVVKRNLSNLQIPLESERGKDILRAAEKLRIYSKRNVDHTDKIGEIVPSSTDQTSMDTILGKLLEKTKGTTLADRRSTDPKKILYVLHGVSLTNETESDSPTTGDSITLEAVKHVVKEKLLKDMRVEDYPVCIHLMAPKGTPDPKGGFFREGEYITIRFVDKDQAPTYEPFKDDDSPRVNIGIYAGQERASNEVGGDLGEKSNQPDETSIYFQKKHVDLRNEGEQDVVEKGALDPDTINWLIRRLEERALTPDDMVTLRLLLQMVGRARNSEDKPTNILIGGVSQDEWADKQLKNIDSLFKRMKELDKQTGELDYRSKAIKKVASNVAKLFNEHAENFITTNARAFGNDTYKESFRLKAIEKKEEIRIKVLQSGGSVDLDVDEWNKVFREWLEAEQLKRKGELLGNPAITEEDITGMESFLAHSQTLETNIIEQMVGRKVNILGDKNKNEPTIEVSAKAHVTAYFNQLYTLELEAAVQAQAHLSNEVTGLSREERQRLAKEKLRQFDNITSKRPSDSIISAWEKLNPPAKKLLAEKFIGAAQSAIPSASSRWKDNRDMRTFKLGAITQQKLFDEDINMTGVNDHDLDVTIQDRKAAYKYWEKFELYRGQLGRGSTHVGGIQLRFSEDSEAF